MNVRLTPEAVAVVKRSLELAGADPSTMAVRLRMAGGQIRPRFVTAPEPDDIVAEAEGVRVFIDSSLVDGDVEIGVTSEHDQLVVRPIGSDA